MTICLDTCILQSTKARKCYVITTKGPKYNVKQHTLHTLLLQFLKHMSDVTHMCTLAARTRSGPSTEITPPHLEAKLSACVKAKTCRQLCTKPICLQVPMQLNALPHNQCQAVMLQSQSILTFKPLHLQCCHGLLVPSDSPAVTRVEPNCLSIPGSLVKHAATWPDAVVVKGSLAAPHKSPNYALSSSARLNTCFCVTMTIDVSSGRVGDGAYLHGTHTVRSCIPLPWPRHPTRSYSETENRKHGKQGHGAMHC